MANLTRDQALEAIQGFSGNQRPVVVQEPEHARVVLDKDDHLVLHAGGRKGDFMVGKEGAGALLKFTGAGSKLFEALEPRLGQQVLTQYLQRTPFGLVVQDDQVVDIQPAEKFRMVVPPERLVDTILETVGEGATFDRALNTGSSKVDLHLVTLQEHAVFVPHGHERISDLVAAGIAATFSPLGVSAPEVHGYTQRRVCTNGMIVTLQGQIFEYTGGDMGGDGRRFWPWLRRSVRNALDAIGPTIQQYQALADQEVRPEERGEVLEGLMQTARLNQNEQDALMAQALEEPPTNLWEAMNLVTWLGTHVVEDPKRQRLLLARAGDIARQETHARLCPTCHHQHAQFN